MGSFPASTRSASLSAFQSLLEEIDRLNRPLASPPCLDHLLEHTHALSHSLSNTLNNLVRVVGACEGEAYDHLKIAIDNATDSITIARRLMLELHHLRTKDSPRQQTFRG